MLRAFVGVNCQRHRFALVLNLDEAVMASGNSDPEMYITQHRGKTSAHAQVLENIVGNLNPVP